MQSYGVREVEKLLRLPRSTIRALIDAGFVSPTRGPRNAWQFSFQDLVVLRTAQALAVANVPRRRITRSVKELRRHLPGAMPLSGLSICAVGDRVIVKEGRSRWHAESGQYLLGFEGDPATGSLSVIEHGNARVSHGAEAWFQKGVALESDDIDAAIDAYEKAVTADRSLVEASINLGRLLHEARRYPEAERVYREALEVHGDDALLAFNFGVLLEDMGHKTDARAAYEAALRADPRFADCHYNLALLCEDLERPQDAIRHMSQYRRLTARKP